MSSKDHDGRRRMRFDVLLVGLEGEELGEEGWMR